MTPIDNDEKQPPTGATASASSGEKAFAIFDYAITVAKVSVVVLGIMIFIIALSGVDMGRLDEHELFQYRMYAAPVVIVGYLLLDYLIRRRRAQAATDAAARTGVIEAEKKFVLSIDRDADRRAARTAATKDANPTPPKTGYAAEFVALVLVAVGAGVLWHDHRNNEIPNAVAVVGEFVSATCVDQPNRGAGVGVVVGPHMSIRYQFPSQSTSARVPQMKCFLDNCEPEKAPRQYMDTADNRVFYLTLADCKAALPAVLAAKASVTMWTGDKDPNASIRARFTPKRATPPYLLLWIPLVVAAVVLLTSGFMRVRRARDH